MPWPQHQAPLPFPTDQIIPGAWINSPITNPPNCPLTAPGAAEGIERNILGTLLEFIQNQASVSPVRCFTYNVLSRQNYDNKEFTDLLNTVLILTAALIESGKFHKGSQAAEFAVERMTSYQYVKMAYEFTGLQVMDPALGAQCAEIEQVGQELGHLVKSYTQQMQQTPPPMQGGYGPGQPPTAGRFGPSPRTTDRFGSQTRQPDRFGQSVAQNTDVFNTPSPPVPGDTPIRKSETMTNSLLDLYGVTVSSDTPAKGRAAPRATSHPTGNTVHVQPTEPAPEPAAPEPPAAEEGRWVVNSDQTQPTYMTPTPSTMGRQNVLYDRTVAKPAYYIKDDVIKATTTERESPMSAGYNLHELAFEVKNLGLFTENLNKPIGEIYNRGKLLKADTIVELEKIIPYYQETHWGGKIDDTVLLSLEAMRHTVEDDDGVIVLVYTSTQAIKTRENLKVKLEALRSEKTVESLAKAIDVMADTHSYIAIWLSTSLTDLCNKVFKEDFAVDVTFDNFCEDALQMHEIIDEVITEEMVESVKERILTRFDVILGSVGFIEGTEEEWGVCKLTHTHRILDLPLTTAQLELSGDQPVGRITKTTATVLHRLIEGAMGETPDHYYWIRTLDGSVLEMTPAPGGSSDWILACRKHIG